MVPHLTPLEVVGTLWNEPQRSSKSGFGLVTAAVFLPTSAMEEARLIPITGYVLYYEHKYSLA